MAAWPHTVTYDLLPMHRPVVILYVAVAGKMYLARFVAFVPLGCAAIQALRPAVLSTTPVGSMVCPEPGGYSVTPVRS